MQLVRVGVADGAAIIQAHVDPPHLIDTLEEDWSRGEDRRGWRRIGGIREGLEEDWLDEDWRRIGGG